MFAVKEVNGKTLWANMHLLFWLSLVPFSTGWMGENNFTTLPVALYGLNLLMAAIAYYILAHTLSKLHGKNSPLAIAIGKDFKGRISVVIYFISVPLAFINPGISLLMYALVAAMWLIPDKRIEKVIESK